MTDHAPPSRHDPLRLLIGSKFPGRRWPGAARVIAAAGAVLVIGAFLGSAVGHWVYAEIDATGSRWPLLGTVAFASCFATLLVYLTNALRLPPPGRSSSSWSPAR